MDMRSVYLGMTWHAGLILLGTDPGITHKLVPRASEMVSDLMSRLITPRDTHSRQMMITNRTKWNEQQQDASDRSVRRAEEIKSQRGDLHENNEEIRKTKKRLRK